MPEKDNYGITVLHDPSEKTTPVGQQYSIPKVTFDLVAIHGLNGDPMGTWTHKTSGTLWLRDLLPKVLPNIRIMTFGYNARFKNFTAQQDLRSIASKLLTELVDLRHSVEEKTRPIVFVCHSLGGIIAKKSLLIGCSEEQEKIQHAVYGIVFLGTPHNGSNLATLGKLVANVVAACTPINPAKGLLSTLQKDSEALLEITEDFIKRRKKLHLVSFFEMEMTHIAPFLKRLIVEHRSAVLNLPDEITIGQYSDHREIVRFRSMHDRNLRPVLSTLKRFEESINEMLTKKGTLDSSSLSHQKASVIPLDIPIALCTSFHGRLDVLHSMQTYFYGKNGEQHGRRTFAICGLGGTGKTQTVLHFLVQNLPRYKTGAIFINASSKASLMSDFSRLHHLLNLPEANDKTVAVKNWLSKEENSQWLMVFDNADDLRSVPISKYFPLTHSGHIVITSRDQEAVGGVAEEGLVLGPLASGEAISLLLSTAGVRQPSPDDWRNAEEIVRLLGSLPLAINQAGAFIRSRQKSPQEYKELFLRARSELLGFTPKLADSERTVLSTWELNFKQVERESEAAVRLLLLFCFLEPTKISEVVLHRGTIAQNRWGEDGEVKEVTAEAEGLEPSLVTLIQNEMDFDTAIEKLRSFSFVSCTKDTNGLRSFSVHPLVQYCATQRISPQIANTWRQQAILLICHSFPRNRYLDSLNAEIGRVILPQLVHVLAEYDKMSLEFEDPMLFRHELAGTLLAASRFADFAWKIEAVDRAKQILKGDPDRYMDAWFTYRESATLRMLGKREESDKALQSFVQSRALKEPNGDSDITPRYNAQRGDLVISFAENLIRQWKLEEAKDELKMWSPINPDTPSVLERITLRARDIILGKTLRYQGHFQDALVLLQKVLNECYTDDFFEGTGWYRVLLSNIAELYCEVGRPLEAEKILKPELNSMSEKETQDSATGRRLRLSLSEALIGSNSFDPAKAILLRLKEEYEAIKKPDHTREINAFRIWLGLARISHRRKCLDEAILYWKQALVIAERLKIGNGIHAGIVRYSIAHILHVTGDKGSSHNVLVEAKRNLSSETRVFWIAGFNSQWYDEIIKLMNERCGNNSKWNE